MHILHGFIDTFIDLKSDCFDTSYRVKIICVRTQSLNFKNKKLTKRQLTVVYELAVEALLLLISYELRVASKLVNS